MERENRMKKNIYLSVFILILLWMFVYFYILGDSKEADTLSIKIEKLMKQHGLRQEECENLSVSSSGSGLLIELYAINDISLLQKIAALVATEQVQKRISSNITLQAREEPYNPWTRWIPFLGEESVYFDLKISGGIND